MKSWEQVVWLIIIMALIQFTAVGLSFINNYQTQNNIIVWILTLIVSGLVVDVWVKPWRSKSKK